MLNNNVKIVFILLYFDSETFYLNYPNDYEAVFHLLHRKNSNIGYTIENCVPCCEMCNRMKLNYDINTFYKHIYKIYHHKSLTTIS